MKILFVCGCLESGMDGVGDYTGLLARRLSQHGHSCAIIALADPHVSEIVRTEMPASESAGACSVLRLPATAPWPLRVSEARRFREDLAPDWISFQLVLYAYNPRGLCFGIGSHFCTIAGPVPSEVMFHEIWIGEADDASLKNKLVGRLQRHIIQGLLAQLQPRVVHTHTPLYLHLLGTLGAPVKLLPLFANIQPVGEEATADPSWLAEKWPIGWGKIHASGRSNWWIFVLFGSIHPEWNAGDFRRRAKEVARRAGKSCAFISIGRPGAKGERVMHELREQDDVSWMTLSLGSQPARDISQCLLAADFGVSPVPPEHLSKSGTAAAMLEHGLPVIVTREPYHYRNCPSDRLDPGLKNIVRDFDLASAHKTDPHFRLEETARQFVGDLKAAGSA